MTDVQLRFTSGAVGEGLSSPRPSLSWIVGAGVGAKQRAYQLQLERGRGPERSEMVESEASVGVEWPFEPLAPADRGSITVRVWGEGDESTPWSEPLAFRAGFLAEGSWAAKAISPIERGGTTTPRPAYWLRRRFEVGREVEHAVLYATAHGVYELELNGQRVGDHELAPGWTSYRHRLQYQSHDVTEAILEGNNVLGAWLADGWYRGLVGFEGGVQDLYGDRTALFAQLDLLHVDGSVTTISTDERWRSHISPIVETGAYEGERFDARQAVPGWSSPAAADDDGWSAVDVVPFDVSRLVPQPGPPVRAIERIAPTDLLTSPSGATIVDVGQNLVGRVRLRVRGEAGERIVLRHAEVLEDGELALRPLRHAEARDEYVLRGDGEEVWEPRFTTHGFRYIQVDGWPGDLTLDDIEVVVIHSDMQRRGWFSCSDPLLNRFHENVVWSMRSNFVDIPTDCPQRDERLGWTGDIQMFAPTAAFLYDCHAMLGSWLADLRAEQVALGTVPAYVPWVPLVFPIMPAAAWSDAAVVVPWVLYERSGDAEALAEAFSSMAAWTEQAASLRSPRGLWEHGFQFGDWLDPVAPPDDPAAARTDPALVATAYIVRSADLTARAADVLGRQDDADRFRRLAEETRRAFAAEFVSANGRVVSDAQTAAALALQFDLIPDAAGRQRAGSRLRQLVEREDHRIGTGFVGTPLLCDALTDSGHLTTAYHLITQQQPPSWLYPVMMGATTIWERWDSMLPDGHVNPGQMTSFNHYAFGAVADWLHRTVGGLAPLTAGYRTFRVAPRPGGGLRWARVAHDTPFGRASVAWERAEGQLKVSVEVPVGTTATVELPERGWQPRSLGPGEHELRCSHPRPDEDPPRPERGLPWASDDDHHAFREVDEGH